MRIIHRLPPESNRRHRVINEKGLDLVGERERLRVHETHTYVGRALPSTEIGRARPSLSNLSAMWETAYMSDPERTQLQNAVVAAVAKSGKTRDHFDNLLRKALNTTGKPLWDIERGKTKKPNPTTLRAIEAALGFNDDYLVDLVHPRTGEAKKSPTHAQPSNQSIDMVAIQQIDLAYGMGAAFTDSPVEIAVLDFPKMWVETITYSPPALLTWARGRGDSMTPTIYDGDLIMIDRSQKKVVEQDAIWAFAVGDVGSIKRLRVKGDRYVILSDNPTVPDDEEPQDFVTIVGRVVFVGAKK